MTDQRLALGLHLKTSQEAMLLTGGGLQVCGLEAGRVQRHSHKGSDYAVNRRNG